MYTCIHHSIIHYEHTTCKKRDRDRGKQTDRQTETEKDTDTDTDTWFIVKATDPYTRRELVGRWG